MSDENVRNIMAQVIEKNRWEDWQADVFGKFFGLDLFDLEKITSLPRSFLEELSWEQGEDKEFFSEGEFKGWPLRVLPIFRRPFLKLGTHYYCFNIYLGNYYIQNNLCLPPYA